MSFISLLNPFTLIVMLDLLYAIQLPLQDIVLTTHLQPHLTNVVINFEEDTIWSVRNKKEAIWGKVLTDGVFINSTNVRI